MKNTVARDDIVDSEDNVAEDEAVAGDHVAEAFAGDALAGHDAFAGHDNIAGDQVCLGRDSSRLVPYANSVVGQERGKESCP